MRDLADLRLDELGRLARQRPSLDLELMINWERSRAEVRAVVPARN
jgi:hypothetical protein